MSLRIRIDLAYDGTEFSGWAAQPGLRTVEDELCRGLATVLRSEAEVRVTVAGRTDAGVHARGQVAHADIDPRAWEQLPARPGQLPAAAAVIRLRGVLPPDIVVRSVAPAPEGFDARFSALRRRYLYRIIDDPSLLDPLRRRDTVVARNRLDVAAMDAASQQLLGLHDFGAFCRKRAGATTVRTLLSFSWRRSPGGVVEGTVVADAFCHSMVRALVGSVVPVGDGRLGVDEPREVLRAAVRDPRITVMPPHGLSLEEVSYPPDADLAARAVEARSTRALPSSREERTRRVHRPADGVSSPLDGTGSAEVG